jgi:hypothetical protein
MTISQIILDSWITMKLSWTGASFLAASDARRIFGPPLESAGFDVSQKPVVKKTTVKVEKLKADRSWTKATFKGKPVTEKQLKQIGIDIGPEFEKGQCLASWTDLKAAGVVQGPGSSLSVDDITVISAKDDPEAIHCSGKVSVLIWNLRRKDKAKLADTDILRAREANRSSYAAFNKLNLEEVGTQPGATQYTGEIPIDDPAPIPNLNAPLAFGLAGLALIAISAQIKKQP